MAGATSDQQLFDASEVSYHKILTQKRSLLMSYYSAEVVSYPAEGVLVWPLISRSLSVIAWDLRDGSTAVSPGDMHRHPNHDIDRHCILCVYVHDSHCRSCYVYRDTLASWNSFLITPCKSEYYSSIRKWPSSTLYRGMCFRAGMFKRTVLLIGFYCTSEICPACHEIIMISIL